MSLMDESFPYDEILGSKFEAFETRDDLNIESQKLNEISNLKKKSLKAKRESQLKKFQTISDLHSKYTLKKYKNIPSKVRQYIRDMEEADKKLKKIKKLPRFNSLPIRADDDESPELDDSSKKILDNNNNNKENNEFSSMSTDEVDLTSLESIYQNHKFNIPIINDANYNETIIKNYYSSNSNSHNNSKNNSNSDNSNSINNNNSSNQNSMTSTELNKMYSEIKELRSLNDYLQTNLDNKVAQAAKLKRANDIMQINILHLEEKLKCNKPKSLPVSYILWSQGKCEQSTQTDNDDATMMMTTTQFNLIDECHIDETLLYHLTNDPLMNNCKALRTPELNRIKDSIKFDDDDYEYLSVESHNPQQLGVNHQQGTTSSNLRLRSNSNDVKKSNNGSDSAIESEMELDEGSNQNNFTSNSLERILLNSKTSSKHENSNKNKFNKNRPLKKNKKHSRFFNKSIWKRIIGCGYCYKEKSDDHHHDKNIFYTQVNLSESTIFEADARN